MKNNLRKKKNRSLMSELSSDFAAIITPANGRLFIRTN